MNTEQRTYDAIVIGAGQGGAPLAEAFANASRTTALIERANVGGTCVNTGCTPTKAMIASAAVADCVTRAAKYGIQADRQRTRLIAVLERKDALVNSFRSRKRVHLEGIQNLDIYDGEASFVGEKTIEVRFPHEHPIQLKSETIVIDTGSQPSIPPMPGIDTVPTLDSTSIMELKELPEHLAILGGGSVGIEFAQMFRRFGCTVTLIERSRQLLSHEDHDIAEAIGTILSEDGITLRLGFTVKYLEQQGSAIRILGAQGNGGLCVLCSHVLIATGRTPTTAGLGLSKTAIQMTPAGHIVVNDRLETSVPGVFAIGDVKGGPAYTHISYDDYRILRTNLLDGGQASTEGRIVSFVVYIDPQLGRVGLSETQAAADGIPYLLAKMPMRYVARALETSQPRGFMKALVDPESELILGAAVLGEQGGEIMSMIQIAMTAELPYTVLRDSPFAHPTYAESLNNLFSTWAPPGATMLDEGLPKRVIHEAVA